MTDEEAEGAVTDLISAVREAVNVALDARVPGDLCPVYDHVPQDAKRFLKVGQVQAEDEGGKGSDVEMMTVEVIGIYQGEDRGVLAQMMFAAKQALNRQPIEAEGALFERPRWIGTMLGDASAEDGVTYAAISHFEIYVEPA